MRTRVFGFTAAVFIIAAAAGTSLAQYKGNPVKKEKLVGVLRSHQLQTREIVNVIQSNGVDFQVTPDVETELVAAGARPQVIAAAKANYRGGTTAVVSNPGRPATGNVGSNTNRSGSQKPYSKDAVVAMLDAGVPDAKVRSSVAERGVDFKLSGSDKSEITRAGGSPALIKIIEASYNATNQNSAAANDVVTGGSNPYNELIDRAIQEYDVQKNSAAAIATLKQAIALDPSQPRAYQQVGFAYLYGQKNFTEAESYMKQAIEHGGSAVFRVFHDDNGTFTATCTGSLFISKDTVRFESDDNKHTFETNDADIKNAKMQGGFRQLFNLRTGAFNIKLKTGEKDSKNYNFAPASTDEAESKMILRLIDKN